MNIFIKNCLTPKRILDVLALLIGLFIVQTTGLQLFAYAAAPVLEGCSVFPDDNIWNTPVDTLPVDSNSTLYVNTIGASAGLKFDFGSGLYGGSLIGIPYIAVTGSQKKVAMTFTYADESDPGPYPVPANAPVEGGTDRHVLVLDQTNCILYELYKAYINTDGSWKAGSGAVYNLKSNALRPASWTSADAAGLPILPGLVRYDEAASGEIKHAVRFTVPQTRKAYIWPARHYASTLTDTKYPPMGQRFRLKASVDISTFSQEVQVILKALKKYGMILSDNGSSWYISGVPDERWNNDDLNKVKAIIGSNFEAVNVSSLMADSDSGRIMGLSGASLILKMIAGIKVDVSDIKSINNDNKVGLEEAIYYFQKIAGKR